MKTKNCKTRKTDTFAIKLDKDYYPKEAVLTTCCQFLKDNYIFLKNDGCGIDVILTPKKCAESKNIEYEFRDELFNNALRYNISQRNKNMRECIVKTALFCSQPRGDSDDFLFQDLEGAQAQDWKDDPLGIAIPWEEKQTKAKRIKRKAKG